ncbi:MAG: hypothetical protein SGJ19_08360 [Planctomycetia bacterium]|nr:hypothetical protein [Planctomycetia bacterium]
MLAELAEAALSLLAARGQRETGGGTSIHVKTTLGVPHLDIRCTGPDLPKAVSAQTAHPSSIPKQRPWVGTYRLAVKAPLLVFDIYWNPGEPLRIMQFSRGDWERELLAERDRVRVA